MLHENFTRKRNLQDPTGVPYEAAFTKKELKERGWTYSMIKRHLGAPNAVLTTGITKYQYDKRAVYAAEGSAPFQTDLLALEDVRTMGPKRLLKYKSYVPAMMKAAVLGLAAKAEADDKPQLAEAYRVTVELLPNRTGTWGIILPPAPPTKPERNKG